MSLHYLTVCVIMALVSSKGDVINVNHLRYLQTMDNGCLIAQYYSPPFIRSDWTCKEVKEIIIEAIKQGCKDNCEITLDKFNKASKL